MRTLVCCLFALTALAVAPAWGATSKSCGDLPGEGFSPASITAYSATCATARKVARQASKSADAPYNGCLILKTKLLLKKPCVVFGFRCQPIKRSGFGIRVGCHKSSQRVAWSLE